MKAFSAEIFTEQTQASLKEEAYKIIACDQDTIRSVLEAEDYSIIMEMDARREYYKHLLEAQKEDLSIVNEAFSGKVIAAIIAGIIAIIGALIAFITGKGKGDSGSTSSGGGTTSSSSSSSYNTSSVASKVAISSPATSNKKENDKNSIDIDSGKGITDNLLSARNDKDAEVSILDGKIRRKNGPSRSNTHDMTDKEFEDGMNDKNSTLVIGGKSGSYFKRSNYVDKDSDIDRSLNIHDELDKKHPNQAYVNTPYFLDDSNYIEGHSYRITVARYKKVANSMSGVDIVDYKYPSVDVCSGNIGSINTLISICQDLISVYNSVESRSISSAKEEFSKITNKLDNTENEIKNIISQNATIEQPEATSQNPGQFLDKMTKGRFNPKNGKMFTNTGYHFPDPVFNNVNSLKSLKSALEKLLDKANKTKWVSEDDGAEELIKNINAAVARLRSISYKMADGITQSVTTYRSVYHKEGRQITNVSDIVKDECEKLYQSGDLDKFKEYAIPGAIKAFNLNEAMMHGDPEYTDNPYFVESMFAKDEDISDNFSEFYQMVEDTTSRVSISIHRNQMRAINEEALIFSETNISDYEKYQRLQAVNEAIGAKIKRAYYNAIAALKEIFRKFMEKLTANFGTTKAYLDRYKNIIMKSNFRNTTWKTQDLIGGINNIVNTDAPAMDFNQMMTEDADDPIKFFNKYIRPRLRNVDMQKDKMPVDGSGINGLNDFFKSYFHMQNHDITITGPQFQNDIGNYYEFLYDIRKIRNSIKKSLDTIDSTAAKVMKQAGLDSDKPSDNNAGPSQPVTPSATEESAVYSYLYQKWFTLNENGILVEAEKVEDSSNNTQQQHYNAQSMKNVADKDPNSDDTNAIRQGNRSAIDTKVKVYVDVCSSMLKAKMSACEFIRNECMTIIRDHVQSYIGNTQDQSQ